MKLIMRKRTKSEIRKNVQRNDIVNECKKSTKYNTEYRIGYEKRNQWNDARRKKHVK